MTGTFLLDHLTDRLAGPPAHLLGLLLADIGAGTLLRCLLIALVVVTPYALHQRAKVRRAKAEAAERRGEVIDDAPPPDPAAVETAVDRIEELGRTLTGDATGLVELPDAPMIDGRPAAASVVDMVVQDALRRSGLTVVERTGSSLSVRSTSPQTRGRMTP